MDEPDVGDALASQSLWIADTPGTAAPVLQEDVRCEVAVVGGGVCGIAAADRLAEAGRDVRVLEAGRLVQGVTGHTTAKLTSQHGLVYDEFVSRFDETHAQHYADVNQAAIETVADRVDEANIDCNFARAPAYTYVTDPDRLDEVHAEVDAARRLGLPAHFVEDPPVPFDVAGAVRFDDQARFHPRRLLLELADKVDEGSAEIHERSPVVEIQDGDPCTVETESHTVQADDVIVATHFPVADEAGYYARMWPKKSYVLAVRLAGEQPTGMHYRDGDPIFSIRPRAGADEDLVLFTGQNHRTGTGDEAERYRRLEETVRSRFDVEHVAYRWTTQDFVSVDGLPFVGPAGPSSEHVYIATGFGGWGLTNGIAAGRMLADTVVSDEPEALAAFDPTRVTVETDTARSFLAHNVEAAKQLVTDQVSRFTQPQEIDLEPGEGQVVHRDGEPIAAYRDPEGELHVRSAICPHMGCQVAWNGADESWDCPCHGSRFDPKGNVIDGPAVQGLEEQRL
jgi:glycine/D-amino acid oxidase-like deaminating enzyme/nitrite reductase/ring-hydroxylating ferredoxin subunit